MPEYWDIYDAERNLTGKTAIRGEWLGTNEYHLVVFAWIRNSDGRYLISRRSSNKAGANMWETVGGSALKGESSIEAVIREVKEEVGFDVDYGCGTLIKSIRHEDEMAWFGDYWLFEMDIDLDQVICQEEEVSEVKLLQRNEILEHIKNSEFFNGKIHFESLFETGIL